MEIKIKAHTVTSVFLLKGILSESLGEDTDNHVFTLMEGMIDTGKTTANDGNCEDLIVGDEEGESSVASVEDQLRKEMTVYEVCNACEMTNVAMLCCLVGSPNFYFFLFFLFGIKTKRGQIWCFSNRGQTD